MSNIDKVHVLNDCHVDAWLNPDRIASVKLKLSASLDLLLAANVLDSVLKSWIELEILNELKPFKKIVKELESQGLDFLKFESSNSELTLHRNSIIQAWSSCHWQNSLESMYLSKKNLLEKISFSMINVPSDELAFEIYHRLAAGESSFAELFNQYDASQIKSSTNGCYKHQPIKNFPEKMHPILRHLAPGELLKPFVNGNQFAVLKMDSWHPALFDDATKNLLLYDQFMEWQQEILDALIDLLLKTN